MSALADYIAAWKTNETERIIATVVDDVVIAESFGPVYYGRERVREWCEQWNEEGSRVLEWSITREFRAGDVLVAEWRFEYHQAGEDRAFLGATIAVERDGKIAELREYAVTDDLYTWEGEWK
ncbi:nuclear transport factor 2 family protein [Plantibacter sp. VKM Ac-2885]|uniref:nuclear transport factor 2 family protein n=1 Tax=Plantibacter sp. VKM Ac-2885 TaxID=2783828 RepID=UPI00188BF10D|nr:nuclear transport factor 2 family protein [Plantibacter sp. VKM Ac-2885]MBF4514095.1 nuclear transport factor 2 family protein [Plantibacter sp. VKM Ac-2885]